MVKAAACAREPGDSGVQKAQNIAGTIAYSKVFEQLALLEHEAELLYAIFKDSKQRKADLEKTAVLEMLVFSATLLRTHYQDYQKREKFALYDAMINEVMAFVKEDKKSATKVESKGQAQQNRIDFFNWIILETSKQFSSILDIVFRTSILRNAISQTNLGRMYWVFCHFTISNIIELGKQFNIFDSLKHLLNLPVDPDVFLKDLNLPNDTLNVLSVAFYAARLLIDTAMLVMHTYRQSESEKKLITTLNALKDSESKDVQFKKENVQSILDKLAHQSKTDLDASPEEDKTFYKTYQGQQLSIADFLNEWEKHDKGRTKETSFEDFLAIWQSNNRGKRLDYEWKKRRWDMAGNAVWGVINLVTNYNTLFNIPGPWAFPIMAVVVCFDLWVIYMRFSEAKDEYQASLARLDKEINILSSSISERMVNLAEENKSKIATRQEAQEKLNRKLLFNEACDAREIASLTNEVDRLNKEITDNKDIIARLKSGDHRMSDQITLLELEKKALQDKWDTTKAILALNGYAMTQVLVTITVSIILPLVIANPIGLAIGMAVCFGLCTLSFAMMASEGAFQSCYEKYKLNQQVKADKTHFGLSEEEQLNVEKEASQACWNFALTIAEKTIVPSIIILTFAVAWQVAVPLLILYVGYKLYEAYQGQTAPKQETSVNRYQLFLGKTDKETSSLDAPDAASPDDALMASAAIA